MTRSKARLGKRRGSCRKDYLFDEAGLYRGRCECRARPVLYGQPFRKLRQPPQCRGLVMSRINRPRGVQLSLPKDVPLFDRFFMTRGRSSDATVGAGEF